MTETKEHNTTHSQLWFFFVSFLLLLLYAAAHQGSASAPRLGNESNHVVCAWASSIKQAKKEKEEEEKIGKINAVGPPFKELRPTAP